MHSLYKDSISSVKQIFVENHFHASCPNTIACVEKLFFHKVKECLTQPEKSTGWEDEASECKRKKNKHQSLIVNL